MNFPNDRLEEFFQNSLKDFGAEPPADMWERMEPLIPPKPKKRPFWSNFNGLIFFSLLALITSVILIYSFELKQVNLESRIVEHGQNINLIQTETATLAVFDQQYPASNHQEEKLQNDFPNNTITDPRKAILTKKSTALAFNQNITVINNNNITILNKEEAVPQIKEQKQFKGNPIQENKISNKTNLINKVELGSLPNNISAIAFSQKTNKLLLADTRAEFQKSNALVSTSWMAKSLSPKNSQDDLSKNKLTYSFNKEQKNTQKFFPDLLKKVTAIVVSDLSNAKRKTPTQLNSTRKFALLPMLKELPLAEMPVADLEADMEEYKMPTKPFRPRPRTFLELSFMPLYASSSFSSEHTDITNQQSSQMSINSSVLLGIQLVPKLDLTLEFGLGKRKVNQLSHFTKDFYYLKNEATHQQNNNEALEYTFELRYSIGRIPYQTKIRSLIDKGENDFITGRSFIVDYETTHELSFIQIPLFLQYRLGHKRLKYTLKGGVIINRLLKDSFSIGNVEVQDENTRIRISALGSSHYLAGSKWANMNLLFSAGLEYQMRSNLYFVLEPSLIRGPKPFYLKKYPWVAALNMGLRVQL